MIAFKVGCLKNTHVHCFNKGHMVFATWYPLAAPSHNSGHSALNILGHANWDSWVYTFFLVTQFFGLGSWYLKVPPSGDHWGRSLRPPGTIDCQVRQREAPQETLCGRRFGATVFGWEADFWGFRPRSFGRFWKPLPSLVYSEVFDYFFGPRKMVVTQAMRPRCPRWQLLFFLLCIGNIGAKEMAMLATNLGNQHCLWLGGGHSCIWLKASWSQ